MMENDLRKAFRNHTVFTSQVTHINSQITVKIRLYKLVIVKILKDVDETLD